MMSIDFLITTLIIVVSPGIGVLYTIATGLSRGARASVVAAFGCTLGIVPHMAAAIMGLAALLHTSALAFENGQPASGRRAQALSRAQRTLPQRRAASRPAPAAA